MQLAKRPGGAPRAAAAGGKGQASEVRAGGSVGGLQAAARLLLYLSRRPVK